MRIQHIFYHTKQFCVNPNTEVSILRIPSGPLKPASNNTNIMAIYYNNVPGCGRASKYNTGHLIFTQRSWWYRLVMIGDWIARLSFSSMKCAVNIAAPEISACRWNWAPQRPSNRIEAIFGLLFLVSRRFRLAVLTMTSVFVCSTFYWSLMLMTTFMGRVKSLLTVIIIIL